MVQAEQGVQDAVSLAKTTIIVRSAVVMYENILSNILHLGTHGIGISQMVRGVREKYADTMTYVRNQDKLNALRVEAQTLDKKDPKRSRIIREMQLIEESQKKLSIRPLIDAGEFNTISESLTDQDLDSRSDGVLAPLWKAIDRLPGGAQAIVKNALITKDSGLFKILNRAVQFGDFIAKAILYDHLIDNKKMTPEDAMLIVTEEFVNYNRLSGRGRDYLESMGLLWFYNYKIRIMKIMGRMMRDRPASSLLYMGMTGPSLDVDSVFSGSLPGAALDGRLDFSIGPEMGLNAWSLHPGVRF